MYWGKIKDESCLGEMNNINFSLFGLDWTEQNFAAVELRRNAENSALWN